MWNLRGRMTLLVAVAIALSVVMIGCLALEPEPTPSPAEAAATAQTAVEEFVAAHALAITAWDLQYFGPEDEPLEMLPNTRASVGYFWERYFGFDGCNWFLGVYSADSEGALRMNMPAETANLCDTPPGLYEQSALFVSSLTNVTEYVMEGEQLLANTVEDQRLLTFEPAAPISMLGPVWEPKFWWQADREMWQPVAPTVATTISFDLGGEVSGTGGCNDYTVTYVGDLQIEKVLEATDTYAELPTITFGPVTSQMSECTKPDGVMEQEQGYFTALSSVAYYFKLGGSLQMLDANGEPLLMFAAVN